MTSYPGGGGPILLPTLAMGQVGWIIVEIFTAIMEMDVVEGSMPTTVSISPVSYVNFTVRPAACPSHHRGPGSVSLSLSVSVSIGLCLASESLCVCPSLPGYFFEIHPRTPQR